MTQTTPTGITTGTTVTWRGQTYQVAAVVDAGLRVDIGIGWAVNAHEVTPAGCVPTVASADFPYVGAEMRWTSPDGRIQIIVKRCHFTWTVETYQGTMLIDDNCGAYADEATARTVARGYAQLYAAEAAAPIRTVRPVARGHQLDMSPSQATAIIMAGIGGVIDRGAASIAGLPTGRLADAQIRAAASRGWVTASYAPGTRRRIIGCRPTIAGWQHARDLTTTTTSNAA